MHGLPTENATQKKLGLKSKEDILKYGIPKFIDECRKLCIENMKVMNQVCREHGVYSSGSFEAPTDTPPCDLPASVESRKKVTGMSGRKSPEIKPGVCFPWEQRVKDLPEITGDPAMVQKIWEDIDALGNMYIWQLLLSF